MIAPLQLTPPSLATCTSFVPLHVMVPALVSTPRSCLNGPLVRLIFITALVAMVTAAKLAMLPSVHVSMPENLPVPARVAPASCAFGDATVVLLVTVPPVHRFVPAPAN